MMKHFILFLFLLLAQLAHAQPGVSPVETIEGKQYYIHDVTKGETVYGIAKIYKVKPDEILKANPEAEKGIKVGEKLKIPMNEKNKTGKADNTKVIGKTDVKSLPVKEEKKEDKAVIVNNGEEEKITHTVQKGETLYGISRQYRISVDRIIQLNPKAAEGINPGDVLVLSGMENGKEIKPENLDTPKPKEVEGNGNLVLVEHVVQKNETVYGLSQKYRCSQDSVKLYNNGLSEGLKLNQTLIIPVDKKLAIENGWRWYPDLHTMDAMKAETALTKKEVYEIGLFLPFFFDKNQSNWDNLSSGAKVELYEPTRQSLDFYHGVVLALDSLKQYGLSAKLHVYDTNRDSVKIKKLISDSEFAKLDLIIGPTDQIEYVATAAKAKQIPMVCPFSYTNKILLDNPYVAKATTSESVMISAMSDYVATKFTNENIILIDGKGKKDEAAINYYRKALNDDLKKAGRKDSVIYVKAEAYNSRSWVDKLQKDKINVLVVPSNDYGYVSSFFNTLSGVSLKTNYKDYQFVVIGTDDWMKFEDIDVNNKLKFNLHIPAPVNINYSDTLVTIPFVKSFRNHWNTDPDKYAMMGFDVSYFFLSGYLSMGKDFINHLEQYQVDGVNTRFRFRRVNPNSGYLNANVFILKYDNYQLVIVE